jgi:tetratricopeptide (TPR) repeat protein
MRNRGALLLVIHIAGVSGAATSQNVDQQRCPAPDPDLSISHCTAMIQPGHETQQNLAGAFRSRGIACARKGQFDCAIDDLDLDHAIRLNPNFALAFKNRGATYARKGQDDRAIDELDQAMTMLVADRCASLKAGDLSDDILADRRMPRSVGRAQLLRQNALDAHTRRA